MPQAVWKLIALLLVVGIGVMVVVQAQRDLNRPKTPHDETAAASGGSENNEESPDGEDTIPLQDEPAFAGGPFDDADDAVSASAETGASSRRQRPPAAASVDLVDLDDAEATGDAGDPFADGDRRGRTAGRASDSRGPA